MDGNAIEALGPIVGEGTREIANATAEFDSPKAERDGVMARIQAAQLGDIDLAGGVEVESLFERANALRDKSAAVIANLRVQVAAIEARFNAQLGEADRYLGEFRSMIPGFLRDVAAFEPPSAG